ncbi:unnamed protein product, partial [Eretmochelys imbricata]
MASALTVLFLGYWLVGRSGVSGWMGTTEGEFASTQSSAPEEIRSEGTIHPTTPPNNAQRAGRSPGNISVRAEGSLPKPSISVSPGGVIPMGGNVTIRCRHQRLGMRFLLSKEGDGNYLMYTDPAGSVAEFPIPSARREHGGSYTCRYSYRTDLAAYSEPSDPVQIIVADPSLPRPSISLSPTGVTAPGADVTVRCREQSRDVRFFLHKAGDLNPPRHMDPAGDGAEFHIPTVGRQHGGNYSCSYRPRSDPFVSSQPSHPVQLVVAEGSYPKPSVSVSPGGVIPMGGNVTIRCRHQRLGMRFVLYKEGDGNYLMYTDPAGSEAELLIPSARREHGGSYTCRYIYRTDLAAYSEPSDPVQIIVAVPWLELNEPDFPAANDSGNPGACGAGRQRPA